MSEPGDEAAPEGSPDPGSGGSGDRADELTGRVTARSR